MNRLLLVLVILTGAILRFYNLNWDSGFLAHPDERNIAMAVANIHWPGKLDPQFFAYNGFPIYLIDVTSQLVAKITQDPAWLTDWSRINLLARYLSAAFSTLTLPLIYAIGGLFATALTAFTVGLIQYAHYGVTESLLVLELTLLIYLTTRYRRRWFLIGLVSGLSLATKTSALAFLIVPLLSRPGWRGLLLLILGALGTFLIASPYTLIAWDKFIESMRYESGVVHGALPVPYTLQFTGTLPYWSFFKNLHWQLGPVLPTLGFLGLLFLPWPVRLFGLIYFGYVGFWHTKFIRYLIPLIPVLILAAAKLTARLPRVVLLFLVLPSLVWSAAYIQVYINPQTHLVASDWIYQNLPDQSRLLVEHWDNRLPLELPHQTKKFNFIEMKVYDPDDDPKRRRLASDLVTADFLILSSRRVYGSILKNPDKYPITSRYYRLLFEQELGLVPVATFASYPQIFGLTINDDSAEETFQIHDHPQVIIFQNRGLLSPDQLLEKLQP